MKREMELIRKIALAVEEEPTGFARENPVIDGYTEEQIAYHVYLMLEAGLVRGDDLGNRQFELRGHSQWPHLGWP